MSTFGALGPLRVVRQDGTEVPLAGPLQRRLLAALLLLRGSVASTDRLGELVWGDSAPLDAAPLQSLLFRLRQRVDDLTVEHRGRGYALVLGDGDVDVDVFERLVLGSIACRAEHPQRALDMVDEALRLWRGDPYEELADGDEARIEITRLGELRRRALEERFELSIAGGRAADVVADLEAFVAREPLRERPRRALMDAYELSGRHADALRVYDAYRRLLADEIGVGPSPELGRRHDELVAADVDQDQLVPDAEPARPPAAGTPFVRTLRPALRRPTSSFVGRDEALAGTIASLGSSRLTTLVGPGGVGKTRLALEVAHRVAGAAAELPGADPIVFCDLTTATAESVVDVVIAAAGVERRADQAGIDRLVDVLRFQSGCIVLDNCEHVLDVAASVAERLIETTERIVVLATSRERLAVDGERVIAVAPLPHDHGGESPATQLLADRVWAVSGHHPDRAELAELAGRLDGLPLALELAAARLQSLTMAEVIEGLDQSLAVLRGGRRTIERHRSLDAALRWSYDLLDGPERSALHAAAIFAAPLRADDVAAVMEVDRSTATELMAALVERSMVTRDHDRFRLLRVVRQFALEQQDATDLRRANGRLARQMVDVAGRLRRTMLSATGSAPVEEYIARVADFRAAIEQSLAADDAATALTILGSLRDLALNSWSFELARWGEQAALAGERVGHPLTVDGWAIAALGAWKRGALDETRRLLRRAEAIVGRGDHPETYELLAAQSTEHLAHGDLDLAIERLRRAMLLPGVTGDPLRLAETYGTLVICKAYAHHPDTLQVADRMMVEASGSAAAVATAWCWYASGECRLDLDPGLARMHLGRAVDAARTGGSTFVEGIAGASLASLEVRAGDLAQATASYRWLISLWLRAGLQSPFWTGMRSVADLLGRVGETVTAVRILGAAMAPGSGHDVFGDDAERVAALGADLEGQVGTATFTAELAVGASLDDAAAAREATAAFDRIESRRAG